MWSSQRRHKIIYNRRHRCQWNQSFCKKIYCQKKYKSYKYYIGYNDNDEIMPLIIMIASSNDWLL